MKTLGNIIWLLFVGLGSAFSYAIIGLLLYVTVVGIPFGKQCFKLAELSLTPFGKTPAINFGAHPIANVIWLLFVGIWMAVGYLIATVFLVITIIGIPFATQSFKLAKLALIPFGAKIK